MSDWTSYSIKEWAAAVHRNARAKGWYNGIDGAKVRSVDYMLSRLSLVHSEVSEAVEAIRVGEIATTLRADGKPEGLGSELADIVIRVFDFAESIGINMEAEIATKHSYNCGRSHRHGGKLA